MIEAVWDPSLIYCDDLAQIVLPAWRKGRVVLVDDAAYAMTPMLGAGGSKAMLGAYTLARELASNADYATALPDTSVRCAHRSSISRSNPDGWDSSRPWDTRWSCSSAARSLSTSRRRWLCACARRLRRRFSWTLPPSERIRHRINEPRLCGRLAL